jgi:hypothetical protein
MAMSQWDAFLDWLHEAGLLTYKVGDSRQETPHLLLAHVLSCL